MLNVYLCNAEENNTLLLFVVAVAGAAAEAKAAAAAIKTYLPQVICSWLKRSFFLRNVKCQWSTIHYARWYQNMYLTELLLRGSINATFRQLNEDLGGIFNGVTDVNVGLDIFRQRLGKASEALFAQQCYDWYNVDKADPPSIQGVLHCPCTRRQARVDIRFEDDPSCSNGGFTCNIYHRGAHHCIRPVSPR